MKHLWLVVGGYTFIWGLWIFNPFADTFGPDARIYDEMNAFMPEWAWGLHAVIIGAAMFYGACCAWPRGMVWGRIAGTYHWLLIALFYALGDWNNTGALTSIFVVVLLNVLYYESKKCKFVPETHILS